LLNGHLKIGWLIIVLLVGPDQSLRKRQKEKASTVKEEIMDSASKQCASSHYCHCEAILADKYIPVLEYSPIHRM
jgi:hypothetical protein